MTHVKPGRAAAAEMPMGQRAAQAGVGLCTSCRHPVRLHGDVGCASGECFCSTTGAELRSGVVAVPAAMSPPSAAELALLDVICNCGHRRTEHMVTGSHVQCKVCHCGVRRELPDLVPEITEEDERRADEIIAAGKLAARKRPRLQARPAASTAQGYAAVVGEHDAVEEVTAGSGATGPAVTDPPLAPGEVRFGPLPATVHVTPAPLDLTPFLGAALYYYPAWFCRSCLQRRHNPGVHCRRPLQPVYVAILPRELP